MLAHVHVELFVYPIYLISSSCCWLVRIHNTAAHEEEYMDKKCTEIF